MFSAKSFFAPVALVVSLAATFSVNSQFFQDSFEASKPPSGNEAMAYLTAPIEGASVCSGQVLTVNHQPCFTKAK